MTQYDVAVIVDACAPWRRGHSDAVERALCSAPRVLVLVSSAHAARSVRHPWTIAERLQLVRAECAGWGARVRAEPIGDRLYQPLHWQRALQDALAQYAPEARHIVQLCPSNRRHAFLADWHAIAAPELDAPAFWALRAALFSGDESDWQALLPRLSPASAAFLHTFRRSPAWAEMQVEYDAIQGARESWRSAPYPPVLATTDALVLHDAHLLLIQRARAPGKGLWALPGGFVDPDETLLAACLRELEEETGLCLDAAIAAAAAPPAVFDAPRRSLRARIITHVYRFELSPGTRPPVAGGDDAGAAAWIALSRFFGMEEQVFEDHFHIVARMLGA